ncbi:MAG: amidohydrolase [Rhodospirillaceae bacterium]|nr:amidohydrolase [Rhodospirillaceae bacterium]
MTPGRFLRPAILAAAACAVLAPAAIAAPATLILRNADIWTVDTAKPTARAMAIEGNRIVKVGSDKEVMRLKGPDTRVMDLKGAFVLPGLIDSHTHMGNAVEGFFFGIRLVDVNAMPLLAKRLKEAVRDVPAGMWITGYDWASAAASAARKKGDKSFVPFTPSLAEIDRIAPDHPVLLRRYDGEYFMNSKGFEYIRITKDSPDPTNGQYEKDPVTGELTGMLLGSAGPRTADALPPRSRARDLIAARVMLQELNRNGFTSIHDIARVDEISQTKTYRTAVERSTTELSLFTDLRARGELTVRVFPILTLNNWADYKAYGITPGSGDDLIRYGALKTFIDGFLMEKPFANAPKFSGGFTFRFVSEPAMLEDIIGADRLGFDPATHATGDKAQRLLMDWYEEAIRVNPPRDRRFRLVHAWYPSRADVARAGKIGAIADIQPHHLIRELNDLEEKLGPERAEFAFPWRTMVEQGMHVVLSSDWPGSFDRSSVATLNPLENIYYAVTRQRLDGTPDGGFHPEQALTVDEAIRGYTILPAYGTREENIKGTLTEGKLADVVVLDRNIRKIPPREIPKVKIKYTIFDGRVVYTRGADEK